MKKVRLFLVFALIMATVLCVTSCTQDMLNSIMGTTCTVHRDFNADCICDVCGTQVPVSCKVHKDLDHDGVCDTEGCGTLRKIVHYDDDHDGMCDELYCTHDGMKFKHIDEDYDHICDDCDAEIETDCEECYDDDEDGYCDECEYPVIICEHRDKNKDGLCDKCKVSMICEHKDADKDCVCDLCGEGGLPGSIALINNKKCNYSFVIASNIGANAKKKADFMIDNLKNLGVSVSENKGAAVDYEVLIGAVSGRDSKYKFDVHELGLKGYTIQIIDTKIVVLAGSNDAYTEAVDLLATEFFGLTENTSEIKSKYVYADKNITKVQDDYKITQITLYGEDIREYKIAYDMSEDVDDTVRSETKKAATQLQNLLYEKAGYWLDIVDSSVVTDKIIFFGKVDKCGDNAFSAKFEVGKISFTSEYTTSLAKVPSDFFLDMLTNTASDSKTLALTAANESYERFTKNAHFVYYDDFGAVGDGETNDADAIYEAHSFANSGKHQKVIGTPGKTYLIGEIFAKDACIIACDVVWTDVKFILDDRVGVITNGYAGSVFKVTGSATTSVTVSKLSSNIDKDGKTIALSSGFKANEIDKLVGWKENYGFAAMLFVSNSSHKNFIRYGVNENTGSTQREIILVDAEGNIDPKVRFLFDYEKVTGITAYKIDTNSVKPITIDGGEFTTRANNQTEITTYTGQRGITIYRAHTTVKNLKHYIVGEPDSEKGSAYPNFIDVQNAYNILIEDCVFTGHKTYYNWKGENKDSKTGLGSYDITTHTSLEVTWRNCTQSNFYIDPSDPSKGRPSQYWGINGGGESKRVTYEGCTLSRFDAHTGIMHAYIIDSVVGSIDLTGGGNLHIINSLVYGSPMIRFREDYGSFWIGDVVIKDSAIVETTKEKTIEEATLFDVEWHNHDFGYKTSLPTSLIVDNLKVLKVDQKTLSTAAKKVLFFASKYVTASDNYGAEIVRQQNAAGAFEDVKNENIMTPPGLIIIRNNHQGLLYGQIETMKTKEFFKDTQFVEVPISKLPECTEHVDENGDFTCDTCWEYISALVCPVHPDTDGDGYCDALACKAKLDAE